MLGIPKMATVVLSCQSNLWHFHFDSDIPGALSGLFIVTLKYSIMENIGINYHRVIYINFLNTVRYSYKSIRICVY
jgi:hypothetical protein